MSIVNCAECGGQISTEATMCPHCGAKKKKATSWLTWVAVWVFVLLLASTLGDIGKSTPPQQSPLSQAVAKEPAFDRSEKMQKGRKAFIDKLIAQGVFSKIETPGNLPRAWVRAKFYALDFETKQSFCNAVLAYYYARDERMTILRLFDSKSGKEIGKFDLTSGLVLE